MKEKIMCVHQFIRPKPSIIRAPGWGWCARWRKDGSILYCKRHEHNNRCGGYSPVTVVILDIEE